MDKVDKVNKEIIKAMRKAIKEGELNKAEGRQRQYKRKKVDLKKRKKHYRSKK